MAAGHLDRAAAELIEELVAAQVVAGRIELDRRGRIVQGRERGDRDRVDGHGDFLTRDQVAICTAPGDVEFGHERRTEERSDVVAVQRQLAGRRRDGQGTARRRLEGAVATAAAPAAATGQHQAGRQQTEASIKGSHVVSPSSQ
ncbi:hypothetical protein ACFJIW_08525 [Tahibacter sp. UC22_41]|uniref:hypothetical protein n=1 Tax=Tahibacter sp. UC22_41 TaxID=3350178 RepID=UPI0036DA8D57